ncbi:MAG TPA: hypothetical protein PLC24_07300 [Myxococcota bacterium]|nr:hypothetical protein [Myxococcota bacterium]
MSITSTFLAGVEERDFGGTSSSDSDPCQLKSVSISEYLNDEPIETEEFVGVKYFVDKPGRSLIAHPVVEKFIRTNKGNYTLLEDAESKKVWALRHSDDHNIPIEIETNVAPIDQYDYQGYPNPPPYSCPTGYYSVAGNCALLCSSDSQCHALPFSSNWSCRLTPGDFRYYCVEPWGGTVSEYVYVYTPEDGWIDPGYQYYHLFSESHEVLESLNVWMQNELDICSWNNDCVAPNDLRLRIAIDLNNLTSAAGRFDWNDNYMYLHDGSQTPLLNTDFQGWAKKYRFFGHEFGHGIRAEAGNLYYPNECANEIHAEIHGALFAAGHFSQTWGDYNQSAFFDEVWGLDYPSSSLDYLPYAQRFVFDSGKCLDGMLDWSDYTGVACSTDSDCGPWEDCRFRRACSASLTNCSSDVDCPTGETCQSWNECNTSANYNNNRGIWTRFIRVWAEGSATFLENGEGESMGQVFSGAGLSSVSRIYSDVIQQGAMDTSTTLQDFAYELIANSGLFANATKNALGAIGMFASEYSVSTYGTTDRPISSILFSSWSLSSSDKNFYAWKENGTGTIKVRYHNGSGYQEISWTDADSGSAPTMVIYNERLHIFWADKDDGIVKFKYITGSGSIWGPYSLGGLGAGIAVDGDFEAVKFNEFLYIVYRKLGSSYLYVSKCLEPTYGCTGSVDDWMPYTGTYHKSLNVKGRPGVGAAAGSGLNGLPYQEQAMPFLYLVYASASTQDYRRLKVSRMTSDDVVGGTVAVHNSAPSSTTDAKIAVTVRNSAYPSAGKYLYLGWKDYLNPSSAYFSILQRWDGNDGDAIHSNYIFTRPYKLGISTSKGISFKEYELNEANATGTEVLFVDGISMRRASFLGRY